MKLQNESRETSGKVLQAETQHQEKKQNTDTKRKWKNPCTNPKKKPFNHQKREYNNSKLQTPHKGNYSKTNTRKCYHCGRRNQDKQHCFYYKRNLRISDERPRTIQIIQLEDNNESFAIVSETENYSNTSTNFSNKLTFLLDSGATDHLVNRLDVFTTSSDLETPLKISVAKKDEVIFAIKRETIDVTTTHGIQETLEDGLYVPEVSYNLLSVRKIQEAGMSVVFSENGQVTIDKNGETILNGKSLSNLIFVEFILNKYSCNQVNLDPIKQSKHINFGMNV